MEVTKKYIAECDDCVRRNFLQIDSDRKSPRVRERHKIINNFLKGSKTILSVGCGPLEPIEINATHACDVSPLAFRYLRQQGWRGFFVLASCDTLPFLPLQFNVAVCQEVIEHLPDLESVRKTFLELNRVAKRFIVTSPIIKGSEKTHKRAFTIEQLVDLTRGLIVTIKQIGGYWYVLHDRN